MSAVARPDREAQGLFLNSIVHSDIRFGGGQVVVDGVSQVITPIHLVDSRPSIINNLITRSADAAIAATPNSFRESNFQDPITQLAGRFIADYDRVGPFVRGNRLLTNTLNGLFVKTRTGAASTTEVMTVAGRFDDLDIVHVLTENLIIQGSAGGAVAALVSPESTTVGLEALNLTGLTNGLVSGTYRYRFAFVDSTGQRGPASSPTRSLNVQNTAFGIADGQVRITALPARLPGQRLAIYRTTVVNGIDGEYRVVGEVDASASLFIDQIAAPGILLTTSPNTTVTQPSLTPTYSVSAVVGLTTGVVAGDYQYLYRTIGPDGSESASSVSSPTVTVLTSPGVNNGRVDIANLPVIATGSRLRIYRSAIIGGVATGFTAIGELNSGTRSFVDVNTRIRLTPPTVPALSSQIAPPTMISQGGLTTGFTSSNAQGSSLNPGQYFYRFAFAEPDGGESTTSTVLIAGGPIQVNVQAIHNQVVIDNLPTIPADRTLRVYRAPVTPGQAQFELVGIVTPGTTSITDGNFPLSLAPVSTSDAAVPVPSIGVALTASQSTLTNALTAGQYAYRFALVSATGETSAVPALGNLSSTTVNVTTNGSANGQILIDNLPAIPIGQTLRIYRSTIVGGQPQSFFLITEVAALTTSYLDTAATPGALLDDTLIGSLKARTDGSLVIDAGAILKLQSARIEVQDGGQLLAEGTSARQIVMTSIDDFTYGAGGSFNTPNRPVDAAGVPNRSPSPETGAVSMSVKGAPVRSTSHESSTVVERLASTAVSLHSMQLKHIKPTSVSPTRRFQNNDDGVEGTTTVDRVGRGTNFGGAIFVRGSQPIIVDNRIINNAGPPSIST